jgi:hypothetical protein
MFKKQRPIATGMKRMGIALLSTLFAATTFGQSLHIVKELPLPVVQKKAVDESKVAAMQRALAPAKCGGQPCFTREDAETLVASEVPARYAGQLIKGGTADGPYYKKPADIANAYAGEVDSAIPAYLSTLKHNSKQSFTKLEEVQDILNVEQALWRIKQVAEFRHAKGRMFPTSSALEEGLDVLQTPEEYRHFFRLMGFKNVKGEYLFNNGVDAVRFIKSMTPLSELDLYAAAGLDGKSAYRFHKLGLSLEEVISPKDTEKPDAIVALPVTDYNSAFEADEAYILLMDIKETYDAKFRLVGTDEELVAFLNQYPGQAFWYIGGHGNITSLDLGEPGLRYSLPWDDERYELSIADMPKLALPLHKMDPQGVVFGHACSIGFGGDGFDNLVNTLASIGGGRRIIGSTIDYGADKIKVNSIYPFDIEIRNGSGNAAYARTWGEVLQNRQPADSVEMPWPGFRLGIKKK